MRKKTLLLKNDKIKFFLAVFTLFFTVYTVLSFFSFLFTWQIDQSRLDCGTWQFLTDSNVVVENWAGKFGAVLANFFIYKWFGISAFAFIFLLILTAFRLIKIRLFPLRKATKYTILSMLWFSVALSFFFENQNIIGGGYGFYVSKWLNASIGKIGTFFLLCILLFTFLVFTFENFLENIKIFFQQKLPKNIPQILKNETKIVEKPEMKVQKPEIVEEKIEIKPEIIEKPEIIIPENEKPSQKIEVLDLNLDEESLDDNIFLNKNLEKEKIETESVEIQNNFSEKENFETENVEIQNNFSLIIEKNQDIQVEKNQPTEKLTTYSELKTYKYPIFELLNDYKSNFEVTKEELSENFEKISQSLKNFGIGVSFVRATIGPTVTLYEIIPDSGVRISRIKNLEEDIALSLAASGIRIIAPMPGRGTIGIEVPNKNPEIVSIRSVLSSKDFQESQFDLPIVLGKTISNEPFVVDLTKMPHLLVAGATGQGKSVGLNAILVSLLYKKHPSQLKLILVDPKKVEFSLYEKLEKHFLAKIPNSDEAIITDTQKVVYTLEALNVEMDKRYNLLKNAQVRNIKEYNTKFFSQKLNVAEGYEFLPYIVLVIDEFADLILTTGKDVELLLARLAQLSRAVGIHLIVATQRPSANIITGIIKANFPVRIAFRVASMVDSRTILDCNGANQLIGRGDMLITQNGDLIRLQCAYIDTSELEDVIEFIASQRGFSSIFLLPEPRNVGENSDSSEVFDKDELFEEAAKIIVFHQQGSIALLQRKLSISNTRAGRIIDQLASAGIVGNFDGNRPRKVLISDESALENHLKMLKS